jgi:P27 family predicted phage terminase small subunit
MPDWLSDEAKAHWGVVSKQLHDVGVLTKMDGVALGLYCEAFARWKHANEQVIKFGPVVKAPSGFPVQSPFLSIANKAWEQMLRILLEFGMTPASRSRVVSAKQEDEESPYRKFAT